MIRTDANGNKDIVNINEYDFRTQKNHNIQSKYINGDYAGIPYVSYVDFSEMIETVNDNLDI